MIKEVYKVQVDGKVGTECYWVFANSSEQAIKKGKILYGARDVVYSYRTELLEHVKIEKDDLEKFLEEIDVTEEDIMAFFQNED